MTFTCRSALALALLATNVYSSPSGQAQASHFKPRRLQTYTAPDQYVSAMLKRVNEERAAEGLSALCRNSKLQNAAKEHSDDMAKNDYMDHTGTDGSSMSERVTDTGYDWTAVAENVAAGQVDVEAVMDSWMDSEGHRENILGDYTMLGVAYAYNADSKYKHYWTQNFGKSDDAECDSGSETSSATEETTTSSSCKPGFASSAVSLALLVACNCLLAAS